MNFNVSTIMVCEVEEWNDADFIILHFPSYMTGHVRSGAMGYRHKVQYEIWNRAFPIPIHHVTCHVDLEN